MQIGYVGLGKMGKNMVLQLLEKGVAVVAWNRSVEPRNEVSKKGAKSVETLEELVQKLKAPRIIWLMVTAGEAVDQALAQLMPFLSPGDMVIDGGNSFYKDTLRRGASLQKKGIRFMDVGVSGGPGGALTGACLMIGGDRADYELLKPLFQTVAAPQAYGYFGKLGSGHFAKMVHNGIEYGMMEAIAEGAAVLKYSGLDLDMAEVFRVYNNRSVIESRLVDWAQQAFVEDPNLSDISSKIHASGEGEWTVKTAQDLKIPVPIIEGSLQVRFDSDHVVLGSPEEYRNKVVSALRGKFGHHPVKKE